ncbi:MAG: LarC family nickel insertion protein [Gammaproteobacteria bacterium]|nr:LarC family nickel insertion protein [Gammaproteobacteria bacterium]
MHIQLDPVGGIAGDMFAAAMLDYHGDWQAPLYEAIRGSGLAPDLDVRALRHNDGCLTGHRFEVKEPTHSARHQHRHWRHIRELLQNSELVTPVKQRAIAIFELLAEAEAAVHGNDIDDVAFHEVGAWDSIADIIAAAWLIEHSGATSWSCSPLPLGRGRIASAHGWLPVPAPATAELIKGFPVFDDGFEGERVTPTGAAILKHLNPSFGPPRSPSLLLGRGYGFGSKTFPGLSNVCLVNVFDIQRSHHADSSVVVCQFEVDDQTPEDLAVGLEQLRQFPGVLDVIQTPVFGKKGRLAIHIQVLGEIAQSDAILDLCLTETTTLGVRWHTVNRATLARGNNCHTLDGEQVRLKRTVRPDGVKTRKVEMADLAGTPGGHAGREQRRRELHALDLENDRDESLIQDQKHD